jgi:Amt family ammonium transporter
MAILVTHVSASVGALTWAGIEWIKYGKPSLVGAVTGMVAGLASITPASGFVGPIGAVIIGLLGGYVCQWVTTYIKQVWHIDDSLDVFAVHGVGGAIGVLLTAIFADAALGGIGLAEGRSMGGQLAIQITGLIAVLIWSLVLSVVIAKAVQAFAGLRVSGDTEEQGLDLRIHGERGYNM